MDTISDRIKYVGVYDQDIDLFESQYVAPKGITYNSKTILLKQNPGRAAVFEELIHSAQYRDGKNDSSYVSRVKCEIEAQKKAGITSAKVDIKGNSGVNIN